MIGVSLANAGLLVQFRMSDPDGVVTLNMRDKPMRGGMYVDSIVGEFSIESDVVLVTLRTSAIDFSRGKSISYGH
ncbi:MAG: hypothetical protein KAJ09_13015 [Deltaproteobacteria bacterium]|nr:hypothetical protein [Deltaproteobacteria bacterium]